MGSDTTIDDVIRRLKDKTMDYPEYLRVMKVADDMFPFLAWTHFREIPPEELTAEYMLNFGKVLKEGYKLIPTESYIRENLVTSADEVATNYCDKPENQGKDTCICYNSAKLLIDRDRETRDYYNNITIPEWKEKNLRSKAEYNAKIADKAARLRQLQINNEKKQLTSGCNWEGYTWTISNAKDYDIRDMGTADCKWPNKRYDAYFSDSYKVRTERQFQDTYIIEDWKESSRPVFIPPDMILQCCNNTVNVGQGGSLAQNISQACNQTAIMGSEKEQEVAKKAEEEAVIKKQAEEEEALIKKKEAEKKDKMNKILIAIITIIVFLGLGFAAYMFFKSKSGKTSSVS